jgi:hypothetical protein
MSIASQERNQVGSSRLVAPGALEKSYDAKILISAAIVAVGVLIAIAALAGHSGASAEQLALMTAYP